MKKNIKSVIGILLLCVTHLSASADEDTQFQSHKIDTYCVLAQSAVWTGTVSAAELRYAARSYEKDVRTLYESFSNSALSDRNLRKSVHLQVRVLRSDLAREGMLTSWILSDAFTLIRDLEKRVDENPIQRRSASALLSKTAQFLKNVQECSL